MGIDIEAKCIVGLEYSDLEEWLEGQTDEVAREIEDEDAGVSDVIEFYFDHASPYYDSDATDWVIGYRIYDGDPTDTINEIRDAVKLFKSETGLDAKVFFTPHVW